MKTSLWLGLSVVLVLVGAGCGDREAIQDPMDPTVDRIRPQDPDNTARNVRDRVEATLTPLDQSNDPKDLEITRQIRKAIVSASPDYSVVAQNIKIITANGRVTLRGPVSSETEKSEIVRLARTVVADGAVVVEDQLEVITNP